MNFIKNRKIKIIIYMILLILILFRIDLNLNNFSVLEVILVFFITFISDNIKIYWKKDERLVSNTVGFLFAFLLGYEYILIAGLAVLFRLLKKDEFEKRIYKTLVYADTYLLAAIVGYRAEGLFSLILFITAAKVINSIFVDGIEKFELNVFTYEYIHFLSLIPYTYVSLMIENKFLSYSVILINLIFLIFYYFIIKNINEKKDEKNKNERLNRFNQIILEVSRILKEFSLKESEDKILTEIADILRIDLGYKFILISLFDPTNNTVKRITKSGISDEQFKEIKERVINSESVIKIMDEKHRFLETYFIPDLDDEEDKVSFNLYNSNEKNKNNDLDWEIVQKKWSENDLLLVALRNQNDEMIGYISCDNPENGLRPNNEQLVLLSVFAQLVSLVLENSQLYQKVVGLAETDGLTKLYNHSKLFVDLMTFEKKNYNISVAFLDMDDFKKINDTYGHMKGDQILSDVARIIKNNVRENDNVYRYGGDEFVIIFRGISKEKCREIILRFIEKTKSLDVKLSFSIGVSNIEECTDYKDALDLADKRAYISKRTGKGKIII